MLTPQGFFVADTQFFLPALTLKWLVFDFGGKEASIDATKEALAAANFGFNATHQKIVFDVTRAYYNLNAVQGRVEVTRASLTLAQTLQDAAESRRGRGLATLPEVLQAREKTARVAYELQEAIAGETDARMALLEAMGVRPTTPLRVAGLSGRTPPAMVEDTADKLVDRALAQRPDLLARVATVRAREAEIRKAQSEFYPRIVVSGNVLQNIGRVRTTDVPGWAGVNDTGYGAAIAIEMPLFDGGLRKNRLGVAQSQRRVAEEELELARDQRGAAGGEGVRGPEGRPAAARGGGCAPRRRGPVLRRGDRLLSQRRRHLRRRHQRADRPHQGKDRRHRDEKLGLRGGGLARVPHRRSRTAGSGGAADAGRAAAGPVTRRRRLFDARGAEIRHELREDVRERLAVPAHQRVG